MQNICAFSNLWDEYQRGFKKPQIERINLHGNLKLKWNKKQLGKKIYVKQFHFKKKKKIVIQISV